MGRPGQTTTAVRAFEVTIRALGIGSTGAFTVALLAGFSQRGEVNWFVCGLHDTGMGVKTV